MWYRGGKLKLLLYTTYLIVAKLYKGNYIKNKKYLVIHTLR